MNNRNLLAIFCLLVVGFLLLWFAAPGSQKTATSEEPLGYDGAVVVGDSEVVPRAASIQRTLQAERSQSQAISILHLQVVEHGTHVPIRAEVIIRDGAGAEGGPQSRFTDEGGLLELNDADALPDTIRIRAFMHEEAEVLAVDLRDAGDDGITVELVPSGVARVRVLDTEGALVAGAHLAWRSTRDDGELLGGELLESVTDSSGRSEVRSATPFWVSLARPKGYAARRVLVFPDGREVELRVAGEELVIEVVDSDSGQPLVDFLLRVSGSGSTDLRGEDVRTDDSGTLRIVGLQYPLVLELDREAGARFVAPEGEGPLRMGRNDQRILRTRGLNPRQLEVTDPGGQFGTRLIVPVQLCGFHVKCIDAETGKPLSVNSEFRADWLAANGTWYRGLWTAHPLTDGLASLPCFDPNNSVYVDSRIVIHPRGFEPARVDKFMLMGSRGIAPAVETIPFRRAQQRVLSFQDVEGNDFVAGNCRVLEAATGVPYFEGATSGKGEVGPFHWPGGDVAIDFGSSWTKDFLVGVDGDPVTLVVASDTLERSERVPVVVPWSLGSVQVVGCPTVHEPLILRTETGADISPVRLDATTLVFEDVPLGPFLIGPVFWVESDWNREWYGLADVSKELDEIGRLSVAWDPRWAAQEAIEGVIVLRGALPGTPFLIPVYGPVAKRILVGSTMRHLGLDTEGRYVIPQGSPVPSALLICAREAAIAHYAIRDGNVPFRILGCVAPGQDASIDLHSLLLSWPDGVEWPGRIMISFELPAERYDVKEAEVLTWGNKFGGFVSWDTPGDLDVRGLLGTEVSLRFKSGSTSWTETVRLSASGAKQRHLVSPGEER